MGDPQAIYLDYHATTPCDPRVVEEMTPYFTAEFGNPASRTHPFGWRAEKAVERGRAQIAALIGAEPRDLVFTSGATEANNLAIFGVARAQRERGDHIVVSTTEHKAVLDPCAALEKEGLRVTRVPVDSRGIVDLGALDAALRPGTLLVSVMHANNETGVIQPLEQIAALTRERGVLLHCDAAQSVGKIPVDVSRLGVDLLSISAHKLYGPKGVGVLYVRRRRPRVPMRPLLWGGGHERGLRSGTLPVPLCVGMGRACEIAAAEMEEEARRTVGLRDRLQERLERDVGGVSLNGDPQRRLPGSLNLRLSGVEANALVLGLREVAISTGSACTSSTPEPSHVLLALGLTPEEARASVRIGLGRFTTEAEIDRAALRIAEEARRLRATSARGAARRRPGSGSPA